MFPGHRTIRPATVQTASGMRTTTRIRSARWCRAALFRPRLLVGSLRRLLVSIACGRRLLHLGSVIVTPRPRRHLGDRGPQSGPQSTFRGRPSRLPRPPRPALARRHWPAAAAGALGAGALIAALVVSGGSGAQPAPAAPTTGSVSAPADGTSAANTGVRAKAERIEKKLKIPDRGPGTFTRADVDGPKVGDSGARLLRYAVKVRRTSRTTPTRRLGRSRPPSATDGAGSGAVTGGSSWSAIPPGRTSPSCWPPRAPWIATAGRCGRTGGCPVRPATG